MSQPATNGAKIPAASPGKSRRRTPGRCASASPQNDGLAPSRGRAQADRSLVFKQRERSQYSQLANFHRIYEVSGPRHAFHDPASPSKPDRPHFGETTARNGAGRARPPTDASPSTARPSHSSTRASAPLPQILGGERVAVGLHLDLADPAPHNRAERTPPAPVLPARCRGRRVTSRGRVRSGPDPSKVR